MQALNIHNIDFFAAVPQPLIVNGYEISKIEGLSFWGCVKSGKKTGKMYRTKSAAILAAKGE